MNRTSPFEEHASAKLYRNAENGVIFGVCAGVADYFGFNLTVTRVLVIVAALFSFPLVLTVYLVLALLLPKDPRPRLGVRGDDAEARVRTEPHATLSSVRYRFRDMDARLQRLEKYVTSRRYKLDREFEQLRDGS